MTQLTKDELKEIHNKSSYHKDVVKNASRCGCFYCLKTFRPEKIVEWIDKKQTALCPHCGIDSVLPNGWSSKEILFQMRERWFLTCVDENGNEFKLER